MRSFTLVVLMVCGIGCTGEIRGDEPGSDEETNSNSIAGYSSSTNDPVAQSTPLTRKASSSWAWRGWHHHYGSSSGGTGATGTGGTSSGSGGTGAGSAGMGGI